MNMLVKDIGFPVAGGLGLCAIIYFFLRAPLSIVFAVPLWLMLIAIIIAFVLFITPSGMVLKYWRYGREGFTFMQARINGETVVEDYEVGSGNSEFVIGEKIDPKAPIFQDDQSGIKLDPTMVAAYADPRRHPGGLNIVGFAHDSLLPQNPRNHLAFAGIEGYVRNEPRMRALDFLPIKEIVELLKKPEHFLEADIRHKVGKYFKSTVETEDGKPRTVFYREFQKVVKDNNGNETTQWYRQEIPINSENPDNLGLVQIIRMARADLEKQPILPAGKQYFCMNEAFKYNPVSYTAQHAQTMKAILQRLADLRAPKLQNLWTYGLIAMGIIGVTIGGIVVASMVIK